MSCALSFTETEQAALLALPGVGLKVVARLEQMGYTSLAELAKADPADILAAGAALAGSSCWKNSPQARAAIERVVELARCDASNSTDPSARRAFSA